MWSSRDGRPLGILPGRGELAQQGVQLQEPPQFKLGSGGAWHVAVHWSLPQVRSVPSHTSVPLWQSKLHTPSPLQLTTVSRHASIPLQLTLQL